MLYPAILFVLRIFLMTSFDVVAKEAGIQPYEVGCQIRISK